MINQFAGLLSLHLEANQGNTLAGVEFLDVNPLARLELEDSITSHGKVFQIVLEDPKEGSEFPQHIQFYLDLLENSFPVLKENRPVLFSLGRILKVLVPDSGTTAWGVFSHYLSQIKELAGGDITPEDQLKGIFSWVDYIMPTVFSLEETMWDNVSTGLLETDGRRVYGPESPEEDNPLEDGFDEGPDWNRPQFDNFTFVLIHDGVETPDWVNTQGVGFMKAYWSLHRANSFLEAYNLSLPYRKGGEKEGIFTFQQAQAYWSLYDTVFTRTVNKGFSRFLRMRNLTPQEAEGQLSKLYTLTLLFRRKAGKRQIRLSRRMGQWEYFWSVYQRCFSHLLSMTGKEALVHNCVTRMEKSETAGDLYRFVSILKKAQAANRLTFEEATPIWAAFFKKRAEFYPKTQVDTWDSGVEENLF